MTSAVFAGILRLFGFGRKKQVACVAAPITVSPTAGLHLWRQQWLLNNVGKTIRWKFFSVDPAYKPYDLIECKDPVRFLPICRYSSIARRHANWKKNNPEPLSQLLHEHIQAHYLRMLFSPVPYIGWYADEE